MEIHNISHLDGAIMYSILNEKLRLECDSLEDLISQLELDANELQTRFDEIGCQYDPLTNQLKLR